MTMRRLLAAALAALIATPAFAGTPVTLNPVVTDTTGHVTLGELFDDAGPASDVVVAERTTRAVVLDADAVQAFARRYGLDWANPQGLRRIIVRGQDGSAVSGGNRDVLAYARSLAAGEIVQASDIVWSKAAGPPADAPADADAVIGMAARRPLREGDAVETHDLVAPLLIKNGDVVQVIYADGGVLLTLSGKAMANASAGETLNILNTASKKVIEAVATGPDQAVVGPEAQRLKAANQLALR